MIQAKQLMEQAEALRQASDDPQIKEKLLAATKALAPKNDNLWNSDWEKFRKSEYYATGGMILGTVAAEAFLKQSSVRWKGGVGPDDVIRNAILFNDAKSRSAADQASTIGVDALTVWSALEPAMFAWKKGSATMALESTLIDLESYATMSLLTELAKDLAARQRPSGGNNQSFWSGHTAHAFTAAGLVCTHHTYMSLYGNKTADNSACWAAMTVASLVGLGRIASDNHYASDVAVGAAVGIFSGLILPRILHYGWKPKHEDTEEVAAKKKKSVQFKFELGTVGEERTGPGGFITGTFW